MASIFERASSFSISRARLLGPLLVASEQRLVVPGKLIAEANQFSRRRSSVARSSWLMGDLGDGSTERS